MPELVMPAYAAFPFLRNDLLYARDTIADAGRVWAAFSMATERCDRSV